MKRDDKFKLVDELSKAVTDKSVYEHKLGKNRVEYIANTNALKINGMMKEQKLNDKIDLKQETEEEVFARIYAERKKGK